MSAFPPHHAQDHTKSAKLLILNDLIDEKIRIAGKDPNSEKKSFCFYRKLEESCLSGMLPKRTKKKQAPCWSKQETKWVN